MAFFGYRKETKSRLHQLKEKDEKEFGNTEDAEVENDNDEDQNSAICFLDPNSVRWMNKRRTNGKYTSEGILVASDAKPLVTPSQAIYLRNIFKGLDYDNQGEM